MPRGADAVVMVEHTQPAGSPRDRNPPRRFARTIRLLCRLRHRARRGAAARRHRDRLARDRHAGGVRHRAGRCRAQAARRRPLHRRRAGAARRSRCGPPRSTTPTARSSPRRSARMAARRCFSARFADDEAALEAAMREALRSERHAGAVRRHLEGRGRRLPPHHRAARQAGHHRAWRRAQAGQAAVPCGMRRQAGRHPAGISDLGDVHLPRHDRAGAAADGRPAAALGRQGHRARCRCGSPPSSAAPNSSWCRWSKATTA